MQDSGISVLFMGNNFLRLLEGLWVTVRISLISVILSIPLGILFGMFMTLKNPFSKAISRIYLEFIRIMPQLVLLFIAYFGVTRAFGWNLSANLSAVIVFTLWGTAEMGDLVRGALISIPKHQYDSAEALGMTKLQTFVYVVVPQTRAIADRIIFLEGGKIREESGPEEFFTNPKTQRAKDFLQTFAFEKRRTNDI